MSFHPLDSERRQKQRDVAPANGSYGYQHKIGHFAFASHLSQVSPDPITWSSATHMPIPGLDRRHRTHLAQVLYTSATSCYSSLR